MSDAAGSAADAAAGDALAGALAGWIPRQRWSGARGAAVDDLRVAARVPLSLGEGAPEATLLVVDGRVGGAPTRYQLALVAAGGTPDPAPGGAATDAGVVARDAAGRPLRDAVADERFRRALIAMLAEGRRVEGGGARVTFEPEAGARPVLERALAASTSRVVSAEQSNTSIVYEGVILKLFRRLEAGEHPDVEVTRFLSRRGFPHTPRLLGVLRVEDARGGNVAGMAQALVPGAADAWAHAVDDASAFVLGPAGAAPGYGEEAARLGAVTRALHDTLASDAGDPDFAPRPAARPDVARWAAGARASVESAVALLAERVAAGALDALPDDARAVAREVAGHAERVLAEVDRLAAAVGDDAGAAVRHHGDYHLGQVLRGADGALYVIDFEGEPARPLEARRARLSAARDVAGMLRSFAYAAASAALEPGTSGAAGPADVRAARAALWEADARARFLAAYFGGAADAGYLPRVRAHADALVTLFEIEKLFYELAYELRNRPDWAPIPLAGIAGVLGGAEGAPTGGP